MAIRNISPLNIAPSHTQIYKRLELGLTLIRNALADLSLQRVAEYEERDEDGNITLLYQDVALLKDCRKPAEPVGAPSDTEDLLSLSEHRKPFHTQHQSEWKIQKSYTARDSIFQLNISLSHGVIEEPTGHEFRT